MDMRSILVRMEKHPDSALGRRFAKPKCHIFNLIDNTLYTTTGTVRPDMTFMPRGITQCESYRSVEVALSELFTEVAEHRRDGFSVEDVKLR